MGNILYSIFYIEMYTYPNWNIFFFPLFSLQYNLTYILSNQSPLKLINFRYPKIEEAFQLNFPLKFSIFKYLMFI